MGNISNLLAMALAVALSLCLFAAPVAAEDVAPAPDAIVSMDTLGDEAAAVAVAVADIDAPTNDLAGLDTDRALTDSGTAIAAVTSETATDGRNTAALGDSPAPPVTANGESSSAAISWRDPRPA